MKTYIIHVSDAYEREKHMQKELKNKNLDVEYINDGDIKDLNSKILNTYFSDGMAKPMATASCAYKHLLSYMKLIEGTDNMAMILEDDIRFYQKHELLPNILEEIKAKKLNNFLISLEDSILRYIPKSKRKKGIFIYPKKEGRLAGGYIIDRQAAENILNYIKTTKLNIPIDWFHNLCAKKGIIDFYWTHPVLLVQGSLDGSVQSLIDEKKTGLFRVVSFKLQRMYKRMLYNIR